MEIEEVRLWCASFLIVRLVSLFKNVFRNLQKPINNITTTKKVHLRPTQVHLEATGNLC